MNESWSSLQAQGLVQRRRTNRAELDAFRALVRRNLQDAKGVELSADNRFSIAYDAVLNLVRIVVACAGYRVKGLGYHQTSFLVLDLAMGKATRQPSEYFDQCRQARNDLRYETTGVVTAQEANELLEAASRFETEVEAWISKNHPAFARLV